MAHLDEQELLSHRQHAFGKNTDINDWAKNLDKGGQITHLIWTSAKLLTHTLLNYLNVSYMAMVLVGRL